MSKLRNFKINSRPTMKHKQAEVLTNLIRSPQRNFLREKQVKTLHYLMSNESMKEVKGKNR